jgi:hypothetical protein
MAGPYGPSWLTHKHTKQRLITDTCAKAFSLDYDTCTTLAHSLIGLRSTGRYLGGIARRNRDID